MPLVCEKGQTPISARASAGTTSANAKVASARYAPCSRVIRIPSAKPTANVTTVATGILLPYHSGHWLYVVSWITGGIFFVLAWLILRGRIGRAFRAVRDSDVAAVSSGINATLTKTLATAISAAFAGAAGSLFVFSAAYAQPDEFGLLLSIRLLIGAAVGGLGSLWGVVGGAIFVQMLPIWAQGISKQAPAVIQGLAVILVMFLLPTGFAGLLRRLAAPLSSRIRNES